MSLEDLTGPDKFISALDRNNPAPNDPLNEGNFHISGMKNVLLNQFPNLNGAVSATDEDLSAAAGGAIANKLPLAGGILTGSLGISNGSILRLWSAGDAQEAQIYVNAAGNLVIDYAPVHNILEVGLVSRRADWAGQLRSLAGGIVGFGAEGIQSFPSTGQQDRYTRMGYYGGNEPVFTWFYGGVIEWAAGVLSDGTWRLYPSGNPAAYALRVDGASNFSFSQITFATSPVLSRSNSGYRTAQTNTDVGMAPGMARNVAVTDGGGNFSFAFGFDIPSPVVTFTVAGTVGFAVLQSLSASGGTGTAYLWNGSAIVPAPAVSVHWQAINVGAQAY